jgi:hypothetical protein
VDLQGERGTMRAVIRSIESSDVDVDTYRPRDPLDDGRWIRLIVGPDDGPGDESFDVLVCTPRWLTREVERDGSRIVRHTLLMPVFDLREAMRHLRTEVSRLAGRDWQELARGLAQVGHWEFQDYRE